MLERDWRAKNPNGLESGWAAVFLGRWADLEKCPRTLIGCDNGGTNHCWVNVSKAENLNDQHAISGSSPLFRGRGVIHIYMYTERYVNIDI